MKVILKKDLKFFNKSNSDFKIFHIHKINDFIDFLNFHKVEYFDLCICDLGFKVRFEWKTYDDYDEVRLINKNFIEFENDNIIIYESFFKKNKIKESYILTV